MNRDQILSLAGFELSAAVAERALGWRWMKCNDNYVDNVRVLLPEEPEYFRLLFEPATAETPRSPNWSWCLNGHPFHTNLNHCREAELACIRKVGGARYWRALADAFSSGRDELPDLGTGLAARIATADATTRCRAILLAMEEE